MPKRLAIVAGAAMALVLVVVAVVVGVHVLRDRDRTAFTDAVAYAPDDAMRMSWTDWSAVREHVGVQLSTQSRPAQVDSFLKKGFDLDLTSSTALVTSAPTLQQKFGFSPGTIDWELFSQATTGAVIIMGLPDTTDFDQLADNLEALGYTRPATDTGVWDGGPDVLARVGGDLTPELQYVALDPGRHLVLTSDSQSYLGTAVSDAEAHTDPPTGVEQVVAASGDPISAAVYSGDYVCGALAMAHADGSDQAAGAQLLAAAGKVDPLQGYASSVQADDTIRVAMSFDDHDEAVTNADTRSTLASGPAPGQGGTFPQRFTLGRVAADGDVLTMTLMPKPHNSYVFSDLTTGPVLFATC